MGVKTKFDQRVRRKSRIRKRVTGTEQRPRLTVFRSARHIYAQIIDDTQGHTLVSACSLDKTVTAAAADTKKVDRATLVGKLVAERAKDKGVSKVVFDRGGYKYMGRVKALADGAREAGLEF